MLTKRSGHAAMLTLFLVMSCGDDANDSSQHGQDVQILDVAQGQNDTVAGENDVPNSQGNDSIAEWDQPPSGDDTTPSEGDVGAISDIGVMPNDTTDANDSAVAVDVVDDAENDGADTDSTLVGVTYIEVETKSGRILPTAVWYPIPAGTTGTPEVYLNLISSGGALRDAPIAPGGPWPLVLFSHGNQSLKEQSVFFTEFLARNGYIVAAPDHIWNTFFTYDESKLPLVAKERPLDITAVIDRLEQPQPSDPQWFSQAIDFEWIGMTGHSFGGYTTLAVAGGVLSVPQDIVTQCAADPNNLFCSVIDPQDPGPYDLSDPRVDCALPMAPGGKLAFGKDGLGSIDVPTLLLGGKQDSITPWQSEAVDVFEQLNEPAYLWGLEHGEHFTFSDICEIVAILPPEQAKMFGTVCSPDAVLPMDVALALIQETGLLFFDAYLKNDKQKEALLTKEYMESQHSEVEFFVKGDN